MGRPKSLRKKKQINLTIDVEALEKGRKTADFLRKSLSEFTENVYTDLHDTFFEKKNASKLIEDIQPIYLDKLKKEEAKKK